jgi:hypothetical protein
VPLIPLPTPTPISISNRTNTNTNTKPILVPCPQIPITQPKDGKDNQTQNSDGWFRAKTKHVARALVVTWVFGFGFGFRTFGFSIPFRPASIWLTGRDSFRPIQTPSTSDSKTRFLPLHSKLHPEEKQKETTINKRTSRAHLGEYSKAVRRHRGSPPTMFGPSNPGNFFSRSRSGPVLGSRRTLFSSFGNTWSLGEHVLGTLWKGFQLWDERLAVTTLWT